MTAPRLHDGAGDGRGQRIPEVAEDGVDAGTNLTVLFFMDANYTMTAVYGPPPLTRVLTVNSSNPNGAVSMLVSPADRSGLGNGMTGFSPDLQRWRRRPR